MRHIKPCFLLFLLCTMLAVLPACGPSEATLIYEEGIQAFNQGDFARAQDRFEAAIAADSTHAKAYLGQGLLYWRDNKFEQALPYLNTAIRLDPTLTMAHYYRGVSLVSLQQHEQSLPDFQRAIASQELPDQDLVRAHRWHGIALLNLERYEEALPDFTRSIEIEPDKPFHRLERGRVYEALGQTEQAIADYTAFLEQSSGEGEAVAEARQRLENLSGVPVEELQK